MPEYLAPGVYVEEIDTGVKTIEGVSTSVAGFVGMTRRGPLTPGPPLLVTSFAEFARTFGGFVNFQFGGNTVPAPLPFAVDGFFANGGRQLFIKRVMKGDAVKAKKDTTGGLITRLEPGAGAAVGALKINVVATRGVYAGTKLRLTMDKKGNVVESNDVTVSSVAGNEITFAPALAVATGTLPAGALFEPAYTAVLTSVKSLDADGLPDALATLTTARPASFTVEAKDAGSWGNSLVVTADHESGARAEVNDAASGGPAGAIVIKTSSVAGFYVNAWVEIDRITDQRYRKVKAVLADSIVVDGTALLAAAFAPPVGKKTTVTVCEFRLTATFEGVSETFSGLTLENVPGHYYLDRLSGSTLIALNVPPPPAATHPFLFPSPANGREIKLDTVTGSDGTAIPTDAEFVGATGTKNGIRALEDIDEIAIIAAPGLTGLAVQAALIEQCERLKDRFAILDPNPKFDPAKTDLQNVIDQRKQFDTKYAAFYYPRLMMNEPSTSKPIPVPPSGHMAGIYARVDTERGVHKAPANEVVRDILGFETIVNKETQELLNPKPSNINVFRDFRADGRGLRIWGARVITSDPSWKYVNVRRLFIFLEESLDEGTQFVVFEPNDEKLWARVTQSITAFLTRVWRDGALLGSKAEEAFFVKCDRTTMTQDDLDNGRLIVLIGVAPVKPAEFVIIRIGQYTASAQQNG